MCDIDGQIRRHIGEKRDDIERHQGLVSCQGLSVNELREFLGDTDSRRGAPDQGCQEIGEVFGEIVGGRLDERHNWS